MAKEPAEAKPPRAAKKRTEPNPILLSVTVDGTRYDLVNGSWGWRDENELYQLTGLGLPKILAELQGGNGSAALIGHVLFLARRGAGETVTLDEAHAGVSYVSEVEIDFDPKPAEDAAPEDPGSD